ncbi:MAG: O-antigen ligase family protein [Eubacteriales bacterium]
MDSGNVDSPKESSGRVRHEKKKRRGLSYYFTGSVIMAFFDRIASAFYSALAGGLFGRIFTAYSAEQAAFERGAVKTYFSGSGKVRKYMRSVRRTLSEAFERSRILGFLDDASDVLLSTSLKVCGNFLLSSGLYTVLVYFLRQIVPVFEASDPGFIITGVIFILAAMPMLTSRESIAQTLGRSRIAVLVLDNAFGFREESFDIPVRHSRLKTNMSIILGMLFGIATLFVSPLSICVAAALVLASALIIATPEIGVVATLFMLPFFAAFDNGTTVLTGLVLICALGYLIKLIRGKRIIRFEILDIAVIAFAVMLALSGIISTGGKLSLESALVCCALMLIYFLVVNMMRTTVWLDRCVTALVSSAVITALYGILQYIFGTLDTRWQDMRYFSDIKGRAVSFFDNPNVLAFYLAIIFPFALSLTARSRTRKGKFLGAFSVLSIVICAVFTWCRGAWLAMIAVALLFLLICSKKTPKFILVFCLAIPLLPILLPSNVIRRFGSIGDISDSSTFYRIYTWRASLRAALDNPVGGVGFGTSAFAEVYPLYAYAGMEAAEHSHNLFLQIMFGMGITGLAVFLISMFLYVQKSFEYFKAPQSRISSLMADAALCAVAGALIMGMFDYIWYDYRVFFAFWAVLGIGCAYIRVGNEQKKRHRVVQNFDATCADIDID